MTKLRSPLLAVALVVLGAAQVPTEDPRPPTEDPRAPAGDSLIAVYRERAADSEEPRDWYNLGTAYLEARMWPDARGELARASEEGEGKVARFSRYNLGVANAMEGHPEGDTPAEERRSRLLAARDAFRAVLGEDAEDPNARWNLELVNRWLEDAQSDGGSSDQDNEQPQGGGGGSSGQQGAADPGGEAPSLTREEAERLLQQAAGAEEDVRNKTLRRGRLRDPVVERNW